MAKGWPRPTCAGALGLDFGRKLGWAYIEGEGSATDLRICDTVDLGVKKGETEHMPLMRFDNLLADLLEHFAPRVLAYERVVFVRDAYAAHFYGALMGATWLRALRNPSGPVQVLAPTVGEIKKHATGLGNAKKPVMKAAARKRWGKRMRLPDDNAVDALFAADLALRFLSKGRV